MKTYKPKVYWPNDQFYELKPTIAYANSAFSSQRYKDSDWSLGCIGAANAILLSTVLSLSGSSSEMKVF